MREPKSTTLVLLGTPDHVIPPEMGRFYKELISNCHLVVVYDAGHAISTERPEAFAEVTANFLERHEAFVISRRQTVINPCLQLGFAGGRKIGILALGLARGCHDVNGQCGFDIVRQYRRSRSPAAVLWMESDGSFCQIPSTRRERHENHQL